LRFAVKFFGDNYADLLDNSRKLLKPDIFSGVSPLGNLDRPSASGCDGGGVFCVFKNESDDLVDSLDSFIDFVVFMELN
jgi:hypothetical protein